MKILNRNHLKIIAILTMLIDHIGAILFPRIEVLRYIGRIAFPIFAFFIAEGFYYTRNKNKYIFNIALFAIITQPIYYFAFNTIKLNVLFTFLFSLILMYLLDNINKNKFLYLFLIPFYIVLIYLDNFALNDYGLLGVMLPLIFYYFKETDLKYVFAIVCLALISAFARSYQILSVISVFIIWLFYNGDKGKYNLKYLFYTFYPLHILIIYLIKFLI